MLNQVILVGRLTSDLKVLKSKEEEKEYCYLTIAIPRAFKNKDGEYDTDFVRCILYSSVATNTAEYCKKGDIVGVKGRIQSDGKEITIAGEKVTFLSSRKAEE